MSNSRNILVRTVFLLIAVLAPAAAGAQGATGQATGAQPPVAYASVSELNGILTQLQKTAQSMQSDLGKTRIEKWKTDGATKRQTSGERGVHPAQLAVGAAGNDRRNSTTRRKMWE